VVIVTYIGVSFLAQAQMSLQFHMIGGLEFLFKHSRRLFTLKFPVRDSFSRQFDPRKSVGFTPIPHSAGRTPVLHRWLATLRSVR